MGLSGERNYSKYHRVLSRAVWSARKAGQQLLKLLLDTFLPSGVVVMGIDDTIERRKGKKIHAKGIYRDPVRSSESLLVKVSGLRWLSLMLLVEIPWAQRVWALPFLSVLAPSERYHHEQGKAHKVLTDWARQMFKQVRRWIPERTLVFVGDSSFAVLELLHAVNQLAQAFVVSRLRLDAALYEPAPEREPHQMGRPRLKGKRLPTLKEVFNDTQHIWQSLVVPHWYGNTEREIEYLSATAVWYHTGKPPVPIRWVLVRDPKGEFVPQAFLCTAIDASPTDILVWFCRRWFVEVTFQEMRAHLGMETQRQWSDLAIERTTPVLLGLFSLVTLMAHHLQTQHPMPIPQTAWYSKSLPTFSDAMAWVRRSLWSAKLFSTSTSHKDMQKVPIDILHLWCDLLCYAA
jgi:DDE superfamily endonuclease